MYRINLYPEFLSQKREGQRRTVRTAVLSVVVGLEVFLVGAQALSGVLLGSRAASLRAEIARLTRRIEAGSRPLPGFHVAQAMARVRMGRVDWSPKLAALSDRLGPSLQLTRVTGSVGRKNLPARFEIEGTVRGGGRPLQDVSAFLAGLRADRRVTGEFPDINVGNIGGRSADQFKVVCTPAGETQ